MGDHLDPSRFGTGTPFSLGVEEELLLVEPGTGRLHNGGGALFERLVQPARGQLEREVHECQVELITDVCANVAEAIDVLGGLRRAVLATGVGIIGSGTHPTAAEGDAEITDKERYRLISALLGDALATPVSALHVHVGMPDAETAIRAFNGLRRHLPLLEALGANSPFRHGRDSGLASAREITLRAWPRSGAPRAMQDYADFDGFARGLTAVADVPDYTFHWWKLRPHPRLGTVEIRALDAQASLAHTASLVAAVHALARHEAESEPIPGPPPEILEEASFRAARAGVRATLPDAAGRLRPVAVLLEQTLELVRPSARALECEEALGGLMDLLAEGGGAGLQRDAAGASGDTGAVLMELMACAGVDRAARSSSDYECLGLRLIWSASTSAARGSSTPGGGPCAPRSGRPRSKAGSPCAESTSTATTRPTGRSTAVPTRRSTPMRSRRRASGRRSSAVELGPAAFGENLTTAGIDASGALVGERWRVGSTLLEVVQPRLPCFKLGSAHGGCVVRQALRPGVATRGLPRASSSRATSVRAMLSRSTSQRCPTMV